MARGDSGTLGLRPLRKVRALATRGKSREEIKRAAHAEAFLLLELEEEVLSIEELDERFDQLGRAIFSFEDFSDDDLNLEEELSSLFPAERRILSSSPTSLERIFLEENLLLKELREGVISQDHLEEMRQSLPPGDWSDEEVLLLSFLKRSLPLLALSGQSMDSLRAKLSDQLGIDISTASGEEIFSLITSHRARTSAERRESLSDTLLLIQAVAASRNDPRVIRVEKIVKDNFSWAQERSALGGREVKHIPLVAERKVLSWLGFPEDLVPNTQGVAACYLPGSGGVQATLVTAPKEEEIDERSIRRVMVHEMLHDTQEGFVLTGNREHDLFYAYTFNEALTEGLAFLRSKEAGEEAFIPAYRSEVVALYQILEKAGIRESDYQDCLTYLNMISPVESLALISERLGQSKEESKNLFWSLFDQAGEKSEKSEDLPPLLTRVFKKSAIVS